MGVRVLRCQNNHSTSTNAVLYCSTTDWAFGPVFYDYGDHDAYERAEAFLKWLPKDARTYTDSELESKYTDWCAQEDAVKDRLTRNERLQAAADAGFDTWEDYRGEK